MLYRPFGKLGWSVSAVGLGTWNIGNQWGAVDDATAWATVRTAFSRVSEGGGYVQDVVRRDAGHLRGLVAQGAILRVCGSRAMAQGVTEALDAVLAPLHLNVRALKAKERYAEDIF